jgi:hypothetical protein
MQRKVTVNRPEATFEIPRSNATGTHFRRVRYRRSPAMLYDFEVREDEVEDWDIEPLFGVKIRTAPFSELRLIPQFR